MWLYFAVLLACCFITAKGAGVGFRPVSKNRLVVGLGNNGPSFDGTRHNIGFAVVDHLASLWKDVNMKVYPDLQVEYAALVVANKNVGLLKPLSYMNLSGRPVSSIATKLKLEPQEILVIVDDFALPFGDVKIKEKGVVGSHNGLKSVENSIKSNDFSRLRVGIGKPPSGVKTSDFVLEQFSKFEESQMEEVLYKAMIQVEEWLTK